MADAGSGARYWWWLWIARYSTELIGTLFLSLTVTLTGRTTPISPITIGCALMVLTYSGGHTSGAHYNPAVTLAVLLRGKITLSEAAIYVFLQLLGGFAGAVVAWPVIGEDWASVASYPLRSEEISEAAACLAEFMFTFALCSVFLHTTTTEAQANNSYFGIAIGFTSLSAAVGAGHLSGAALNPVLGSLCVLYGEPVSWIYWVGPLAAGALAALLFRAVAREEFGGAAGPLAAWAAPCLVEASGTMLLCFACSTALAGPSVLVPLGVGCMLMALVYMGGATSGGHFNPAVTLAVWLRTVFGATQDNFTWWEAVHYVPAQLLGAFVGALAAQLVTPASAEVGHPALSQTASVWQGVLAEVAGTFLLAYVVLNVATVKQLAGNSFFGVAVGMVTTAMVTALGPVSGAALNPAVGLLGPMTGTMALLDTWIYWVGCPAGACLAALFFRFQNFEEFEEADEGLHYMLHSGIGSKGARFMVHCFPYEPGPGAGAREASAEAGAPGDAADGANAEVCA